MPEIWDEQDRRDLMRKILMQAMDDYVKLHPRKTRERQYLEEAFQTSAGLLFDEDFRLGSVPNDEGEDTSLKDMIAIVLQDDLLDVERLREKVAQDANEAWDHKLLHGLPVPCSLNIAGYCYGVLHEEALEGYRVDYNERYLYLDRKTQNPQTQEAFVQAIFEIILYHEDVPILPENRRRIGKSLYRCLQMNLEGT